MLGRLLTRALVLVFIGLVAGVAHSWVNATSDRPVLVRWQPSNPSRPTRPEAPPPGDDGPASGNGRSAGAASPQPDADATADAAGPAPGPLIVAPPEAAPAATDLAEEDLPEGYIGLARAKELFDSGLAVFVDARNAEEFIAGHVENAMHLPPESFRGAMPRKAVDYLLGQVVVVYCGGGLCDASENVAKYLQQAQIPAEIYVFKDGYPAWAAAGFPTQTGPDTYQ